MKKLKNLIRHKKLWLLPGVLLMTMTNCLEQDPKVWAPDDISLQIAEYIELNSDRYSEFNEMILRTEFVHLLKARGPYTLFLPTNEAMQNFYTKKGISSIDGLTLDEMERLVRTHLFAFLIPTGAIGLGSLPDTNALGDFISSEFQGSDILISKHSKIIKRDIINANGYIHVIDRVIEPITKTIYKIISEDSDYSIFVAGLERTGLSTVLETISGPYGNTTVRIWFTLLAVPDAIYNSSSINSVDDLIQEYSKGILPLTNPENGFYKYMEYHCLEGVHYLSAIRQGIYPVISRENNVTIRIDTAYKINYDPADSSFVSFIPQGSNVSSKNGVIHAIDDILPPIEAIPISFDIHTTHFPDLQAEDCYLNYIKNFMDGADQFAKIKWQGDYMQYYYKSGQNYKEADCISMSQGFWWLEITIPKVPKGKYLMSAYFKVGENRANMICYIDDVKTELIVETRYDSKSYMTLEIAEVDWTETTEHKIKFVTLVPGILYIDRFIFDPIL